MLSKTIFAATALATAVAATELPTCWSDCFAKYEVDSEGCLCSDSLGKVVSSCIASGCESSDSEAYDAWLSSYCYAAPVSSNTWSAPASTYEVPSSIPVYPASSAAPSYPAPPASSAAPSYPAPSGSWGAPSYPAAPSSTPVYPVSSAAPYPSSSACAGKTTLIWRSSTSVVYGGVPSGSAPGYGAPSGTGAAYPSASSWSPVPATGAGAKVAGAGLGAFGLIAGVAALLL